ncbi:MAG: SulP family inorganic anion transporter [Prosthecobacter sp.]|nr:SulP family inorganic anion transporter [Prosthecobacter sp.]
MRADLRAALSVSLLDLPQGMAYAALAGLPLQAGTMCSAVSGIVGSLFSSSRYTVLGPTNATAFMVFSFFSAQPQLERAGMMPLLVFMVGTLLLFGAFLRVAELAQYISRTVVVAYVTGASLLIITSQLAVIMDVSMTVVLEDGTTFQRRTLPGILMHLCTHLLESHWQSLAVAATTAVIYAVLRHLRPRWPVLALSLIFSSLLAALAAKLGMEIATYADARFGIMDLLPAFPDFVSPRFFSDFSHLFGLAVALAFLATLENASMSKTLASVTGHRVDPNQDMFSLGVTNLACAYLSGMPSSGSLTRSALNYQAGARTPVAAFFNGVFCLAGALLLGRLVGYLPRASLAVLIICVAVSLINRRHIRVCLSATGSDALVFLTTLAATLMVPLHVAIFTGVGVSVMLYLRKASQPRLVEYEFNQEGDLAEAGGNGTRQNPAVSIVHVEGELFFGAADLFRTQIQRTCADPNLRVIILRLKNARHLDATCVLALEDLVRLLRKEGRELLISGVMKDVHRVLRDSGLVEVIGRENIFPASTANPNLATRNALKRAQTLLGTTEADVKIFFDPSKKKHP